ncbi:MAG: acetolactate synthase large subunit [Myxococcota bacterium]|jgi:acetolactate synthase-1/2/3 large subunit|nr:acetolactate synthase large subunit [Myxococcota bacterium]
MMTSPNETTGADALIAASAKAGIEVCFANAGTSEMAMLASLMREPGIRVVPVLFEGVASGAADGYARMASKPASTMLHLGPGLANASANLHNARRGQSPVVNWIGDHATWLMPHDPPLHSDIHALATNTSKWVGRPHRSEGISALASQAVRKAQEGKAGVSSLILPMNHLESALAEPLVLPDFKVLEAKHAPEKVIEDSAQILRVAEKPLLLLGGPAMDAISLRNAARIGEAMGAKLMVEQFPRNIRREEGLPVPERLAYLPMFARQQLANHDLILCLGADRPACFFGYGDEAPLLTGPNCEVLNPIKDGICPGTFLADLVLFLGVHDKTIVGAEERAEKTLSGPLQPETICRAMANLLPHESIVICEGITSSLPLYDELAGAAPHHLITNKGGSIGFALSAAVGAAIAAPKQRVVSYVGDGSAAYTIQALWTQARENLNVTNIICVNRAYVVLQMELMRMGVQAEGVGEDLTHIGRPDMNFAKIAEGFGVPAVEAHNLEEFSKALEESFARPGPGLIAAVF